MVHQVCSECLTAVRGDAEVCGNCGRTRPDVGWAYDPLVGVTINGRYRVEGRLGEGGMGTVYRAARTGALGGKVAIKVLSPALSRTVIARRFEREAQIVSQLSNPHIVRIYDFDTFPYPIDQQPLYYIAMELVQGKPLNDVLREQPRVSTLWAIDILRQTARGLDEAHTAGIVHRDLKPHNLMVIEQRRATHVKILDFGIAGIKDRPGEEVEKLTRAGLVAGTPDYMAPEQAMGRDDVGPPADMYALGIIAFQLFAGRLPFQGRTAMDILTQRLTQPTPSLVQACPPPALPEPLYGIVDRLLAKEPKDRFQNAAELLDALQIFPVMQSSPEEATSGSAAVMRQVTGHPLTESQRSAPTLLPPDWGSASGAPADLPTSGDAAPVRPAAATAGKKTGGAPWGAIAALVLLLGGGGGAAAWWFLLREPAKPAPAPTAAAGPSVETTATVEPTSPSANTAGTAEGPGATSPTQVAKPETAETKPEAKPETAEAKPENAEAKPETAEAKPETAEAKPETAEAKPLPVVLDHERPPLEPGFEALGAVPVLAGAGQLGLAAPSPRPPLYQPMALRLTLDRGAEALRLSKATVRLVMPGSGATIATAEGTARTQDGRVPLDLPPFPVASVFRLDVTWVLADGSEGTAAFTYDAAKGQLQP